MEPLVFPENEQPAPMVMVSAETVEKPFSTVNECFWGVSMTPNDCEIVDCGAFCEVIFFCFSHKNLFGDFFDSIAMNAALLKVWKIIIWRSNLPFSELSGRRRFWQDIGPSRRGTSEIYRVCNPRGANLTKHARLQLVIEEMSLSSDLKFDISFRWNLLASA